MEAAENGSKAAQEEEAKKERSTGHNPEECPVCMTVFDDTVQRPRTLPCGHTVCTLCVIQLKRQGHVTCPECRVSHAVPEGGEFPVCYIVEAFIRRKKEAKEAAAASPPPISGTGKGAVVAAGQKEAAGLSRRMRSFLQEQESSVVAAITACQELQAQLDQYQTTLSGWGEQQQQQMEDRLQGLLEQSRSARELVQQEESRLPIKKEEAREGERQLHTALEALRTPETDKEAGLVVAEVFRCRDEAEQVLEECRGSFPDANTATTVRKVRELDAALTSLQNVQAALETHLSVAEEEPRPESEADGTIEDRLQAILTPNLKAENLRSPTQPVRSLLEAGRVFGVHQMEVQRWHARISLEAGRLYLHTLKEGPPPPGTLTLEVSQVVPPSPPCVVFLDLSWPGSAPRRVYIRVSPDTPRARQMVLLCTGQHGLSYAGSCLNYVKMKRLPGEFVIGGNCKNYDEFREAILLPGLHHGEYRKSGKAGSVSAGPHGSPGRSGVGIAFAIVTRDRKDDDVYDGVFGEVVEGLDAVVTAAQHRRISEVKIEDCGLVLWE